VYQTDYKGWYSDTSGHIKMMEGDRKHARLFGYMRTGTDGGFELKTIKPQGYPDGPLPGHIHFEAFTANSEMLITELLFDDDKRLNEKNRDWAKKEGFTIAKNNRKTSPVYEYELFTK
jgi:protocatechuate 3,4-dioxygenase beta subunit